MYVYICVCMHVFVCVCVCVCVCVFVCLFVYEMILFLSSASFLTTHTHTPSYQDSPDWTDILTHFRGSELQNFFTKILEDDLKAVIKPQYVDQIPKAVKVAVGVM